MGRLLGFTAFVLLPFISGVNGAGLAAMSVDFGSQFLKIGLVKPGVPMEIVLNRESHRKTAALVGIRNGERTFSADALNTAAKHPKQVYGHLADLLGKKWDNPMVDMYRRRFPQYTMEKGEDELPVFVEGDERYSVMELVAMLLAEAKSMTEAYAEQAIKDVVISVPAHFNQAERRAMATAARIAGLNLLQLMNENAAMGVNYGMFRRNIFNESATHTLVFDMGATKTTATVYEYQVVKDKVTLEKNPQVSIIGYGYDRKLGGLEMTLRLRDILLKKAEATVKSSKPIRETPRAMAKLMKEAERLKLVLSANTEFVAQIENLLEEQDFRARVTRDEFELPNQDIWDGIRPVLDQALRMSELGLDQIDTILLFGGATRTPMVQLRLKESLGGREPARFLNTDEAVALGAVYQAAHLSAGFKVKRFMVKDATLFPIQVDFAKEPEDGETIPESDRRIIHRTLFGLKNPYPQKKVMTFSKHRRDFTFNVNYGELKWMTAEQQAAFGTRNLSQVDLSGIAEAAEEFRKEKEEEAKAAAGEGEATEASLVDWKGIKAHFRVDDSGLLHLDGAEVILERTGAEPAEESTLSKLGKKLGSLFSSGETPDVPEGEAKDAANESDKADKEKEKSTEKDSKSKSKSKEKADEKADKADNATAANTTASANATEPKARIIKKPLSVTLDVLDVANTTELEIQSAKLRLEAFLAAEKEKAAKEGAQNALESFIYETNDRLDQEEYSKLVTPEDLESIREKLKAASVWAEDEADFNTKASEYEDKLKPLKEATKDMFYRHEEERERPRAEEAFKQMLNYSSVFLAGMRNLTEDTQMFTDVEMDGLEKMIKETTEWKEKTEAEQSKLKPYETPVMTMYAVGEKVKSLDREVKYLLNKAKIGKPLKEKEKKTEANATDAKTDETADGEKAEGDKEDPSTPLDEKTEDSGKEEKEKTEEGEESTTHTSEL